MKSLFLDTSGLFMALDRRQPQHQEAVTLIRGSPSRVTHSGVLLELIALGHSRGVVRERALQFVERSMDAADIEVIWVGEAELAAACQLLRDRADKEYSLCDAVSFAIMRERRIVDALTTDKHFVQEGFVRLLLP